MATLLSYALTNLSDVKESLHIPSGNTTYDNLIIRKINQATRAIEAYCGRRFQLTTYTDVEYNGTQIDQIILRQRPITAFTSFGIRDTSLNQADWDIVDTNLYFVDTNSGVVDLNFRAVGRWKRYRVSYTAGYGVIPEDLAEACVSLACFYFNNADATDVGVQVKKEGQRELRYGSSPLSFNSIMMQIGIDGILNNYANNPIMGDR